MTFCMNAGTHVTYWSSTSTSTPGFLRGGIVYNNGYITVPRDGLYYVYSQFLYDRSLGKKNSCSFYIKLNDSNNIGRTYHNRENPKAGDESQYTGVTVMLTANDRLSVTAGNTCRYEFFSDCRAFFGAFYIG